MAGFANPRLYAAAAVLWWSAALPLLADARPQGAADTTKHRHDAPLRFEPPAAGPAQQGDANYAACIDQPSPDGATSDCHALLRAAPAAKPKTKPRPR